jgi:hypothetical protein
MITAKQARDNVENSNTYLQVFFEKIDYLIDTASKEGRTQVHLDIIGLCDCVKVGSHILPNAKQVRIMDELKSIGYNADLESWGDHYVPRGLQDDHGNGPNHVNLAILVRW